MRLKQQNPNSQQPPSPRRTYRRAYRRAYRRSQCRAKSDVPMCSDDDWVSKCPSGCRLQGLISQMESEMEMKLRKVCKMGKMYEDAAESSMKAMTHIYNHNRRAIVNRYMLDLKFVDRAEGLGRNLSSLRTDPPPVAATPDSEPTSPDTN
ncbi:fibrinogen alpha chain [Notolabrus celidotus]|uniref:fibrinogen alpha chain n=1 Tax=Notolabrus celidotus TaxID=1203425 RepID=UPI00148F9A90|nr:fibrinogen alpha chain [Notolabrus celidotus]